MYLNLSEVTLALFSECFHFIKGCLKTTRYGERTAISNGLVTF